MKRIACWLLYATIPIAIGLQFAHVRLVWEFVFACAAVLPLAAWIGFSTEQLAQRMGSTYGALFNATFGNFAEIALFVTPLLVFLSYPLGHPLDLLFTPFEMLAVGLCVAIFSYLVMDGETNWYEGIQLLAVYAIIAVALYFLPFTQSAVH